VASAIPVAPECAGAELDLDAIFREPMRLETAPGGRHTLKRTCPTPDDLSPLLARGGPDNVEIKVTVPASIAPGGSGKLTITYTNLSAGPLTLQFHACDPVGERIVELYDARSARADFVEPTGYACAIDGACSTHDIAVTLAPGGHATSSALIHATKRTYRQDCGEAPAGPIPPGTYSAKVRTALQWLDPTSHGGPRVAEASVRIGRP
jgi:hypothetical protein